MRAAGGEGTGWSGGRAYWGRFLLFWLFSSGVGTLLLFLLFRQFFSSPLAGGYGAVFHALRHLAAILLPFVALSVIAYVLLVGGTAVLLCVVLLHRISGPVFRLERVLGNCLEGEPVKPFFIRHTDLVPDLASAFNRFMGRLREDRQRWMGVMESADRLCLQDPETCRAEMEKALEELATLLSRYR